MSVPTITANPDSRPHAAAGMTEELMSLAGQAQHWQRALLRTVTQIEALTEAEAQSAGTGSDRARPDQAVGGVHVRTRLADLLDGAPRVSWLRTGTADPHRPTTEPDLVAELLLGRGDGVRALIGTHWTGGMADDLGSAWQDSAAEVRVGRGQPTAGVLPYDVVITAGQPALMVWAATDGHLRADAVAEPALAGILQVTWDVLWANSLPLTTAVRLDALARDEVKLAILEQLETGTKDEVIARTLGMSLRTCRRHIAELFVAAGAVSRFQAGSRLARIGLFDPLSP